MDQVIERSKNMSRGSVKRKYSESSDSEATPSKIASLDELIIQAEEEEEGNDNEPESQANLFKLWHPKLLLTPPYFKYVRITNKIKNKPIEWNIEDHQLLSFFSRLRFAKVEIV